MWETLVFTKDQLTADEQCYVILFGIVFLFVLFLHHILDRNNS